MNDNNELRKLIEPYAERIGGVITALREIVQTYGHIEPVHFEITAEVFNISVAEVRGIVSFYSDLVTRPRGRRQIRICQAEACQALGSRQLTKEVEGALAIRLGETSADLSVSLEPVYCLGLCDSGPNATVNDRVLVRATLEALTR